MDAGGVDVMVAFARSAARTSRRTRESGELHMHFFRRGLDLFAGLQPKVHDALTLVEAHRELSVAYAKAKADPKFQAQVAEMRKQYNGGPTPLYFATRLTEKRGGAQIWLTREELAFTGAHKINNAVGQGLLAVRLGKKRIIAETGADYLILTTY